MNRAEQAEKGTVRREARGDQGGRLPLRAAAPENQKNIQDDLSAYCFGDFYTRKFLTIHERELLTFSILASQGGCEG